MEVGRRFGTKQIQKDPDGAYSGTSPIEASIFGLLGLLVAFTISGAASRLDHRRDLIIEETNAIGTAYLRLDLLTPVLRDRLRNCFRRYVDSRLEFYREIQNKPIAMSKLGNQSSLQDEIWNTAVEATGTPDERRDAGILLLPALNAMFDIRTTRMGALFIHTPASVFVLLIGLALVSTFIAGYELARNSRRNWLFIVFFTGILSISVYMIIDLEYPRYGLIRISEFDQLLVDLRANMK